MKRGLRVRVWSVLRDAVERGVAYGWRRAHKHTDTPNADAVRDTIEDAVVDAICEAFEVDEDE